jgi:uncharacterized protein (TIGR03435 family)
MKWFIALASFVLLTSEVVSSQTQPAPMFEVASVRPYEFAPNMLGVTTLGASKILISGNRVTSRGSLLGLLMAAYGVRDFQISGDPGWTDKLGRQQFFDIAAKTEGDATATADQVRQMLQSLLADRFQLRVHRETKESPVYDLVVGKNGSKLKEHIGDTGPAEPVLQSGLLTRFKYSNRPIADLVALITRNVDRPVLDRTGLAGGYDFTLEFTWGNPELVPRDSPDADRSIFSALQQQLGLKLVAAKEPIEVLVIDHVEKPSEN